MEARTGRDPTAVTLTVDEVERFVLDFIRAEHPKWVEDDGGCPRCRDYYDRLGEIVPETPTVEWGAGAFPRRVAQDLAGQN